MKQERFSFKSRRKSFGHAFQGLFSLLKSEQNAWIHLFASILAVITGIILKISSSDWVFLTIVIGLVFLTELINTAVEELCDIVDPEWNEKIKKAKDLSAAAVLIAAIVAVIAGCLIFLPGIIRLLSLHSN